MKNEVSIYDQIPVDEFSDDLMLIMNICGEDTVRELLKNLGGTTFYIPKITYFKDFIESTIMKTDKTDKQLAMHLGISEQCIRITRKKAREKRKRAL